MGQRHQAFLIARVIPDRGATVAKYRCVAALHHQWCYGRRPLSGAYRFIELAKQDDNAAIIREELRCYPEKSRLKPEQPCEYACYLLEEGFNLDIENCDASHCVYDHPANIGSHEGDNNDGITVLDISDLKNISVCFVNIHTLGGRTNRPRDIPLTPEQYLRAYYPETDPLTNPEEPTNLDTLAKLEGTPIVSLAALAEVWPHEYRSPNVEVTHSPSDHETQRVVASLADLSLDWAITNAIKENQMDLLEHVLCLPGKSTAVLDRIKSLEELPPSAIQLLHKHFKTSPTFPKEADLSAFALSGSQVLHMLGSLEAVERLNVSGNKALDNTGLSNILRTAPKLGWLNIIDTGVTCQELEGLLEERPGIFYHVNTILHPFFYEDSDRHYPYHASCDFWYSASQAPINFLHGGYGLASLPLLSIDGLIQSILDFGHFADEFFGQTWKDPDAGTRVGGSGRLSIHSSGIRPLERKTWDSFGTRNIPFRARKARRETQNGKRKYTFILRRLSSHRDDVFRIALDHPESPSKYKYGILVGQAHPESNSAPKGKGEGGRTPSSTNILKDYERCVDIPTFLELLQEEGRPPPSDLAKLQQVYDIFSRSNFQLATLDFLLEILQKIDMGVAETERW